jgi:hypothetical protein
MTDLLAVVRADNVLRVYSMNGHGAAVELASLHLFDASVDNIATVVEGLRPYLTGPSARPAPTPTKGTTRTRGSLRDRVLAALAEGSMPASRLRALLEPPSLVALTTVLRELQAEGVIAGMKGVGWYLASNAPTRAPTTKPAAAIRASAGEKRPTERSAAARAYVVEHPGATTREVLNHLGLKSTGSAQTRRLVNAGLRYEPTASGRTRYRWFLDER